MTPVTRMLATLAALAAVPAAALTGADTGRADRESAPRPGLTLPAPAVLAPSSQSLAVGAAFRGNYPSLGVSFGQGMNGGLELAGAGEFRHARVDWPGSGGRYDADEFQAALRWGTAVSGPVRGGVMLGAGFTSGYARTRFDDGRYALDRSRTRWAEVVAGTSVAAGLRATVAERYLHDVESRTDTHATVFGTESPALGGGHAAPGGRAGLLHLRLQHARAPRARRPGGNGERQLALPALALDVRPRHIMTT